MLVRLRWVWQEADRVARIWVVARTDVDARQLVIEAGLPVGATLSATVEPQTWARILSPPKTVSDAVLALVVVRGWVGSQEGRLCTAITAEALRGTASRSV